MLSSSSGPHDSNLELEPKLFEGGEEDTIVSSDAQSDLEERRRGFEVGYVSRQVGDWMRRVSVLPLSSVGGGGRGDRVIGRYKGYQRHVGERHSKHRYMADSQLMDRLQL